MQESNFIPDKYKKYIKVRGAAENNLKNIDVDIPRDSFVVLTGLSGSGKSSLAFDTLYAEGQRRYMESLSSYARMFLGQMEKPNVEKIEGLSPAISIDQKSTNRNPRSTVGTVTEIYDYFRLLYARIGIPHCPNCGKVIEKQTADQMTDRIMELPEGTKFMLLAPVVRGKKGRHEKIFESAKKSGYSRVRCDGIMYDLSEIFELEKNLKHTVEIVVDRLVMKPDIGTRLSDSVETALRESGGMMTLVTTVVAPPALVGPPRCRNRAPIGFRVRTVLLQRIRVRLRRQSIVMAPQRRFVILAAMYCSLTTFPNM